RLMVTTRSMYCERSSCWRRLSRPPRPSRPPRRSLELLAEPRPPSRFCVSDITRSFRSRFRFASSLELQTTFAGGVGTGRDASVVLVSAAVEDDLLDAGLLGAGGDGLADLGGLGLLVALDVAQRGLDGGRGAQGVAGRVVDDLGADVARGAVDDEARGL